MLYPALRMRSHGITPVLHCCTGPRYPARIVALSKMGNTQTCGFGVLNKSDMEEINVGLSMSATHKFENGIKPGEIFYRWPGAVHYTVYAFARQPDGSNDITVGQVAKEVTFGVLKYGATMGAMLAPAAIALAAPVAAYGAATLTAEAVITIAAEAVIAGGTAGAGVYVNAVAAERALGLAFEKSNLYCQMKGCYGGGSGSWLVVEGGPYMDSKGFWQPQDLKIRQATQEEVFENGNFTSYSHGEFHTKEDLQCTTNCSYCY